MHAASPPTPLDGHTVLVTRPGDPASLAEPLRALGARVVWVPVTRIEPLDPRPVRDALARLVEYDWLVVTSPNGARLVLELLGAGARDALAEVPVCAVGPVTARTFSAAGIEPAVVPEGTYSAEGLVQAMRATREVAGGRALFVAAEGAREVVPEGLRALGALVDVVEAYRSVVSEERGEELRSLMETGGVSLVVFTAPSTVRAFVALAGRRRVRGATIGAVTTRAARAAGVEVVAEAAPSTADGMVAAIARWATGA